MPFLGREMPVSTVTLHKYTGGTYLRYVRCQGARSRRNGRKIRRCRWIPPRY